jgi:hypothetical protein
MIHPIDSKVRLRKIMFCSCCKSRKEVEDDIVHATCNCCMEEMKEVEE